MSAVFIGHGNPMNSTKDNPYREAWLALGKRLPNQMPYYSSRHIGKRGTQVCSVENPQTIHDFGGFPAELFAPQYPAPGSPKYASMVCDLLPANELTSALDWV